MSPGKEIGISNLPAEILKQDLYSKNSGKWDESLKNLIESDLEQNIPNLYDVYIEKIEKIIIQSALNHSSGKKIVAAKKLGLGRNTITRKIKDLGL